MRAVSSFSFLYFVAIIVVGTLVMINLLIAIIINNFDNSRFYSTKDKMLEELKKHYESCKDHYTATARVVGQKVALRAFGLTKPPKKKKKRSTIKKSQTTDMNAMGKDKLPEQFKKLNKCFTIAIREQDGNHNPV